MLLPVVVEQVAVQLSHQQKLRDALQTTPAFVLAEIRRELAASSYQNLTRPKLICCLQKMMHA